MAQETQCSRWSHIGLERESRALTDRLADVAARASDRTRVECPPGQDPRLIFGGRPDSGHFPTVRLYAVFS